MWRCEIGNGNPSEAHRDRVGGKLMMMWSSVWYYVLGYSTGTTLHNLSQRICPLATPVRWMLWRPEFPSFFRGISPLNRFTISTTAIFYFSIPFHPYPFIHPVHITHQNEGTNERMVLVVCWTCGKSIADRVDFPWVMVIE